MDNIKEYLERFGFKVENDKVDRYFNLKTDTPFLDEDLLVSLRRIESKAKIVTSAMIRAENDGILIFSRQYIMLSENLLINLVYPCEYYMGANYRHIPHILRAHLSERFRLVRSVAEGTMRDLKYIKEEGFEPAGSVMITVNKPFNAEKIGMMTVGIQYDLSIPINVDSVSTEVKIKGAGVGSLTLKIKVEEIGKDIRKDIKGSLSTYKEKIEFGHFTSFPNPSHIIVTEENMRRPINLQDIPRLISLIKRDIRYIVDFHRGRRGRKDILERMTKDGVYFGEVTYILMGKTDETSDKYGEGKDILWKMRINKEGLWYEDYRMEDIIGFNGENDLSYYLMGILYFNVFSAFLVNGVSNVKIEDIPQHAIPFLEAVLKTFREGGRRVFKRMGKNWVIDYIKDTRGVLRNTFSQDISVILSESDPEFFVKRLDYFIDLLQMYYRVKPVSRGGGFQDVYNNRYVEFIRNLTYVISNVPSLREKFGLKEFRPSSRSYLLNRRMGGYFVLFDGVDDSTRSAVFWVGKEENDLIIPVKVWYGTPNLSRLLKNIYDRYQKEIRIKHLLNRNIELAQLTPSWVFPVVDKGGNLEVFLIDGGVRLNDHRVRVRG